MRLWADCFAGGHFYGPLTNRYSSAIGFSLIPILCAGSLVLLGFQRPEFSGPWSFSGIVVDKATGEVLIGAHVFETRSGRGVATNAYGFFSLRLDADSVVVEVSHVGYETLIVIASAAMELPLQITLTEKPSQLDTLEVSASRGIRIQEDSQMSRLDVLRRDVQTLPVLLGEPDLLKTLQLLPGVKSGMEGSSGLYVRGGSPDQNLILLDGAPVYNVTHLFGFFSTFNSDALNSVSLYKGGFPARYGGRLSSVLDVQLREGNHSNFEGRGSVGLIASRLTVEGPIVKNRSSFLVSARRTYLDLLTRPFQAARNDGILGYYFYDLNAKVNVRTSTSDHLFLSLYLGEDRFYHTLSAHGFDDQFRFGWGNSTATFRWNRILSSRTFASAAMIFSRFRYGVENRHEHEVGSEGVRNISLTRYISAIRDWSARVDVDHLPNASHALRFGVSATHHMFRPGIRHFVESDASGTSRSTAGRDENRPAMEGFVYFEDEIALTPRITIDAGLHASGFHSDGRTFWSLEPRLSSRILLAPRWAVKSSIAAMRQYLHLLTHSGVGLPTDLWVPTTRRIGPESAWQAAAGIAHSTGDGTYEISMEGYYKPIRGIIEYREGAGALGSGAEWHDGVARGRGTAYGMEWFVQKKHGRNTGWVGYTLAWSTRQFPSLNSGRPFPFRYDRRHDISIVFTRKLRINTISLAWVYGTGNAVTLPSAHFRDAGDRVNVYDQRNGVRMRAYHRLDVSVHTPRRKGKAQTTLSVYNLYNRRNPFLLYADGHTEFDPEHGLQSQSRQVKQVSLFPVVPSLSFQFTF